MFLLSVLLACDSSAQETVKPKAVVAVKSAPAEVENANPQEDDWATKEAQALRALVGPTNVKLPPNTHQLLPAWVAMDYNVYPADNGVVLQGIASGPIGNHESASFWVTGVHDPDVKNGPSHLEAVLVYAVECDDCPGEKQVTVRIDSQQATSDKPADLLGVKSLKVHDLQKNGTFEIILDVRFRPCCDGVDSRPAYSEIVVLKVEGEKIERWTQAEQRRRPR